VCSSDLFENIAYGLQNQGAGKGDIRRRVDELLDMVGLAGSGPKYPAQLSGGQQQRVALARALAMSPGLLLLDEPLSALDARVRANLRDEIKRVQRRLGVTTIMVTHDQEEALAMADRIVVMNLGVIEQVGTPLEIYRAPGTRFVADFVGHMNFLAGTVDGPGQVRLGDVTIDCHEALNGVATGREVMVCVRPEDIVVRGLGAEARNVIPVHVDDLEFLGSFYRARLSPPGMDAGALTADFSVNAVRDLGLKAETSVPIQLPSDRIRVFATGR
jgi:iron(III) transport system ATP-binding protein